MRMPLLCAVIAACSPSTPPATPAAPPADKAPSEGVIHWVGQWSALAGMVQDGGTVVLDPTGHFVARIVGGPEGGCCYRGTYETKGDSVTFKQVGGATCDPAMTPAPALGFEEYTHVVKRDGKQVVLARPGHPEDVKDLKKSADGDFYDGFVWTFTRQGDNGDLGQLKECAHK